MHLQYDFRIKKELPPYLFDGTMCYLPSKIDSGFKKSTIFEGRGDVKDKHVEIELRLINELHPSDNDYVHVSTYLYFWILNTFT